MTEKERIKSSLKGYFEEALRHTDEADLRDDLWFGADMRFCTRCGKAFNEGYKDFEEYFCPECFEITHQDKERWAEDCEEYFDECYYSEWDAPQVMVDAYNETMEKIEQKRNQWKTGAGK